MCEYCCEALTNCEEVDVDGQKVTDADRSSFFGTRLEVFTHITEKGTLFQAVNDGFDLYILDEVEINYCPMCGAAIPHPTPTQIAQGKTE